MKIDLTRFAERFRQETRDNLSLLDAAIVQLDAAIREKYPPDDILREMMRLAHAVKGAARMLGFSGINRLCHNLEEMLIALRSQGDIAPWQIDLVVDARKGVEKLLSLNADGKLETGEEPVWLSELTDSLKRGVTGIPLAGETIEHAPVSAKSSEPDIPIVAPSQVDLARQSTVRVNVDTIDDLLYYGRELTQALDGLHKFHKEIDSIRIDLQTATDDSKQEGTQSEALTEEGERITNKLLFLSINLRERIAEVDRSVRQIDNGAVELRMRPISELFETIPLQARELGKTLGKEVLVEFSGEDVRLDGRIVELLREPIVHIIRNALDHGIEAPEVRNRLEKSTTGRLSVGAFENAGWARVVISDDGRGINLNEVWLRAVELGLAENSAPPESEIKKGYRFLFDDRFTSRRGATDISGRGVGLAAVKRRLQELRGDVTVESEFGMGAKFTLSMPSSLSSQRILVTSITMPTGRLFVAFPTAMVRETAHRDTGLETHSDEGEFSAIESQPLSLSNFLTGIHSVPQQSEIYMVLCTDGQRTGAFAVDQIVAETEVVIQPLPHIARSSEIIAGAAPLTSDEIIFVLNIPTLLNQTISKRTMENSDA